METAHRDLPELPRRARELRMLPDASLWGWGSVHRTAGAVEALAVASGRETLRTAGLRPAEVDALVLCSTRFPDSVDTHGRFAARIMAGLGIGDAAFFGVTLNRCANLLAGLWIAHALATAGAHRCILVVTADRAPTEEARITDFALFSDGAASCLVTRARVAQEGWRILAGAAAQDTALLDRSDEISSDLARQVNDSLLQPLSLRVEELAGLFPTNLYRPITLMKERQAGFRTEQIYTDNIERVGHCFAADPLINLVDRTGPGGPRDGDHYLLAASVPGSRIGVLLQGTAAQ
ncbi:beta-ketoacyl-[acyl-carrier-protein] synthase family protein [Streptacidiphilus griseoplanus]|uniref:3-oxoacyl-ACP synthase n=1 Tax=Peterkaempfera griseoplana TaxID=66896 RepID=UPI001FE02DDD|nr:3-oxoacyl-ACP synthase [Peterkaempfera griseoplana]